MRRRRAQAAAREWRAGWAKACSSRSHRASMARPNLPSHRRSRTRRSPTWSSVSRWRTGTFRRALCCRLHLSLPPVQSGADDPVYETPPADSGSKSFPDKSPGDSGKSPGEGAGKPSAESGNRTVVVLPVYQDGWILSCGMTLTCGAWPGRSGRPGPTRSPGAAAGRRRRSRRD